MLATDLSASTLIGASHDVRDVEKCLIICLGNSPHKWFSHMDIIHGLDCSVRVFGQQSFSESCELPERFSPRALAAELFKLTRTKARYLPPPRSFMKKGWTIWRQRTQVGSLSDHRGEPKQKIRSHNNLWSVFF